MNCKICNKNCNGLKGLSIHLKKKHNYDDIHLKEYYDKYIKKENEGECYFCNDNAIFFGFSKGYHRICKSEKCLGKTRATGTYEFLMYKYNLSKDDAVKLMNKRSKNRGIKIKESLNKELEKNSNFYKEKSHQTKEYWIKRGFNEKDAINKSKDIMDMIHEKTWEKRKKHPELYDNVNTTQLKYWIDKGYNENESIEKRKERQSTFTLEKCIEKYGEINGLKKWNNRQINWKKSMKKSLIENGNYKKDFSNVEKDLINNLLLSLPYINENNHYSYMNKQFFIYDKKEKSFNSYDFVYKNKIIEFNGDYWHCNPKIYKSDFLNLRKQMYAYEIWNYDKIKIYKAKNEGYEVLIIWENEYKQNKEKVIQQCINFLKND